MSLTTQLYSGELGRWCQENLPGTPAVAAQVTSSVVGKRPVRPAGRVDPDHWAAVGGAFGQRLAFLVDGGPPYYALLGAVRAGLGSRSWAESMHEPFATHQATPVGARGRWSQYRPIPTGWLDLGEQTAESIAAGKSSTGNEPVLSDFVRRTASFITEHTPVGQLGTAGAEAGLARCCWVLSGWESCYRGGQLPADVAAAHTHPGYAADDLRRVVTEPTLAELVELAQRFETSGALLEWRHRADNPQPGKALGISAPVIVSHWADGDLVVGETLVDVKTVVRVDQPDRVARWLWQLLGYLWLDTQDLYGVRSVALYLARHGVTISWGGSTFADMLLGGNGRADAGAREEFLQLARHVIAAEGGNPPGPWVRRQARLRQHVRP